jgi:hypothetical protein
MSNGVIVWLDLISKLIVPVITVFISILWKTNENKKLKSSLQVRLIERYHSVEFYKEVRSTVWNIYVKWFFLPEEKRMAYQQDVIRGWVNYNNKEIFTAEEILTHEISLENIDINHHLDDVKKDSLTEHQALSIYFSFWITVYDFLKTKPGAKFIEYWKNNYDYDKLFIFELRKMIKDNGGKINNPALKPARESVQRVLNPSARINSYTSISPTR